MINWDLAKQIIPVVSKNNNLPEDPFCNKSLPNRKKPSHFSHHPQESLYCQRTQTNHNPKPKKKKTQETSRICTLLLYCSLPEKEDNSGEKKNKYPRKENRGKDRSRTWNSFSMWIAGWKQERTVDYGDGFCFFVRLSLLLSLFFLGKSEGSISIRSV